MSYRPIIALEGYAGWTLLKRSLPRQISSHENSAAVQRDETYFRQNIAKVKTAEDLVSDRRLLRIVLTAFGLEGDLNSKAFIKKVLTDGVEDPKALANRLADKSYATMAIALGLGKGQSSNLQRDGFAETIFTQYTRRSFESQVGEQSQPMRIALNAERELTAIANSKMSEDSKWFSIMGSKPLRSLFETAFNLPASFAQIDIDRQLKTLKSYAQSKFGDSTISQFSDSAKLDKLVQNYLVRDQIKSGSGLMSSQQAALQLLQR